MQMVYLFKGVSEILLARAVMGGGGLRASVVGFVSVLMLPSLCSASVMKCSLSLQLLHNHLLFSRRRKFKVLAALLF